LAALGALGAGLSIAPSIAVGQVALETTGSDSAGNRFYKVEKATPSNMGLAKLICATPFGGKGADTIRVVRVLRDRTILVAGNREARNDTGGGFTMGGMIFRGWRESGSSEGTGFMMRLVVDGDKTVTPKARVDLPGTLHALKLDSSGRICLLLDHSAVYMIEPGASEPIKNCTREGIRDFCTDSTGDLLVLTKEDLIRYDASWKNELWKVKVPCHGVNQGGYLTVCEKTGMATVVGSAVAFNGRGNWRGPYAHGFNREGKKMWTLWDFDPKGQLSKKDGGNDLTADTWGRSARMGRDGKVYMEILANSEKTVLTRDVADANKPIDKNVFAGSFESEPGKGYSTSGQAACVLFRVDPVTGAVEHGTWMSAWLTPGKRANPLDMIDVTTDEQGRACVVGRSDYGCPVKDPWYYEEDKFRGHGFLAIFDKDLQMLQCGYFHQTILTSVDAAYGYVVAGGWTLSGSESQGMNLKVYNPIKDSLSDGESEGYLAVFSTGDHGKSEELGPLVGGAEAGTATAAGTLPKPPVVVSKTTPAEQAVIELELAKDLLKANKTADGMAKLEYIVSRYGETPAGASAKALIASLAKDAEAAKAAKAGPKSTASPEDEKAADRLLQQAENYLANNMKDMARAKLQEIVKKYPTTSAGKQADQMLLKIFAI
jgi:hypothetical protein